MTLSRHRATPFAVLLTVLAVVTAAPQPSAAHQPNQVAARPAGAIHAGVGETATRTSARAPGRFQIVNRLSGKCLVVWGSGHGVAITQVGCNGADSAQWWYLNLGGTGTIRNQGRNVCLDLWGGGRSNGQLVFTFGCRTDGFHGQLWRTVHKGGQYWEIRSYASDKCLDLAADNRSDGAVIQQWGCNWGANDNQQWWIR